MHLPGALRPRSCREYTAEEDAEAEALAKEYTRRLWKRRAARAKQRKHIMQQRMLATWALPTEELQQEATYISDADCLYPRNYRVPRHTPPLRGWHRDTADGAGALAADDFDEYDDDDDEFNENATVALSWEDDMLAGMDDEDEGDEGDAALEGVIARQAAAKAQAKQQQKKRK